MRVADVRSADIRKVDTHRVEDPRTPETRLPRADEVYTTGSDYSYLMHAPGYRPPPDGNG